MINTST